MKFPWTPIHVLLLSLGTMWLAAVGCEQQSDLIDLSTLGSDEVAVAALQPVSGQLTPNSAIGITFSRDLVPEEKEIGVYLEDPPARISPELPGFWKWTHRARLQFVPDERYAPNVGYEIVLDPTIAGDLDLALRGPRRFRFTVEPFAVQEIALYRERLPTADRAYQVIGTVSFNYPVAAAEFGDAFSLQLDRRGDLEFDLETTGLAEQISFRSAPVPPGDQDEELVATVAAGLETAVGEGVLTAEATQTLTIPAIERLSVQRLHFLAREGRRLLRIDLSAEVAPKVFQDALTIDPEPENLTVSVERRRVFLAADWQDGAHYDLRLAADLRAVGGLVLEREFRQRLVVDDLQPSVAIAGNGNYLSLRGERLLGIETVNVEKLTVELDRVFPNNLVYFCQRQSLLSDSAFHRRGGWNLSDLGTNLYREDLEVAEPARNSAVVTPFALEEMLAEESRGIFRLTVRKENERSLSDSRWLVATDLGLVAKRSENQILVAVASIENLTPLAGVEVKVLSRHNQLVAEARTDSAGIVLFDLTPSGDLGERPYLVVATAGNDLSFLAFDDTRVPTGDLDIGGFDHPARGYRAFLYSDRGIYRPGDTAHLAWLIRDPSYGPPAEFPLILRIMSPGLRVFTEARVSSGIQGMGEFTFAIPDWAQTGYYTARLFLDEESMIGHVTLAVEEFIPDRMKASLDLRVGGESAGLVRPGEEVQAFLQAMTLFGPPAADRQVSGKVTFSPVPIEIARWPEFRFGDPDPDRAFPPASLPTLTTDSDGQTTWTVPLPKSERYHGWLEAKVEVEVTELGGGRTVSATGTTVISPVAYVLGLHRLDDDRSDYAQPDEPIAFEAILTDLDGRPHPAEQAQLRVFRKQWRTVLRKDPSGRYRYLSEYDEQLVHEEPLILGSEPHRLEVTLASQGSYRLVVEAVTAGDEARGAMDFYVYGWGYSPWAMSHPERVNLKLDRTSYRPGDLLSVSLEAPFAGLMLLTIERDRVLHRQWVRLEANSATVQIRLPDGLEPNAYLVATLLRPLDSLEIHAPARAFGAVPIVMDRSEAWLAVELEVPEVTLPRNELEIDFRLPDLPAGESAQVTIAAVDEGILQVTRFASPSPLDFFFQKRRLSTESFDIWSLLVPEYSQVLRHSSPGGGEAGEKYSIELPPGYRGLLSPVTALRVKPVAFWSGIITGRRDQQTISFDLPDFNGALRVMAVAAEDDRFGAAEAMVRVRDPIVLNPNLPRFLAPGDEFTLPVQVYNGISEETGEEQSIRVELATTGPVEVIGEAAQEVAVPGGQERLVTFRARARDGIGAAAFTFTAEAAGERTTSEVELPVRPPFPRETQVATGVVRQDEPAEVQLTNKWYPGTGKVTLSVSALPVGRFGAALKYLLRYPFGCVEQITSRSFPLLSFAELAKELAPDSFGDQDADYFIHSGIDYLVALYLPGQGFATWPGGGRDAANPWASVYATHFLVEASRRDYMVPQYVLDDALAYLGRLARSPASQWGGEGRRWPRGPALSTRAYATYVLALAGAPDRGAMSHLAQEKLEEMTLAARAHLAGAFGLIGNQPLMEQLLPAGRSPNLVERSLGYSWSSAARDEAILLEVLATVVPDHEQIPVILQRLGERAKGGRWHNTQENGFALMALGKIMAGSATQPASGEVLVDGERVARFGPGAPEQNITLTGEDWDGGRVTIRATGPGLVYYSILDEGVPREGATENVSAGLEVTRSYFDLAGNPVDLSQLDQGEMVIARLALSSSKGRIQNVVLSDLVPAGLEVENPRLGAKQDLPWTRPRGRSGPLLLPIEHLEIRDDRLLLFTIADHKQHVYHYALRAVTAGSFVLPPVKAEAMYDPDVMSVQDQGRVSIHTP